MAEPARPVGRPRISPAPENYYSPEAVAARRAYMTAYKANNAATLKTYYRAWRAANPDKHRQYNREWSARDRARRAAAMPPPNVEAAPVPEEEAQPPAHLVAIAPEFVPV